MGLWEKLPMNVRATLFVLIGLASGCADEASESSGQDAAVTSQDSGSDVLSVDSPLADSSSPAVIPLDSGVPDASAACITVEDPAKGVPSSKKATDSTADKHTFFFKSIAVDPKMTGIDGSMGYGLTPYPISAGGLESTTFKLTREFLLRAAGTPNLRELEWLTFAHQFGAGLDTVEITVKLSGQTLNAKAQPNIYASYGYASFTNFKQEGDKILADVAVHAFGHYQGATDLGIGSLQDATDFLVPAKGKVPPSKTATQVDIVDAEINVKIGADTYDSVQYRALRGQSWGPGGQALVSCP